MGSLKSCGTIIFTFLLQLQLIRGQADVELVSNKDNTFVIAFPAQAPFGAASGTNSLYLTADEDAYALMQVPSQKGAMDKFIRLRPGGTMRVDLPGSLRMPSMTGIQVKNGISIVSNVSISVYAVSMITDSSDGYLALPLRFLLLGNEYMVITYTPAMHAVVLVTAKHDATTVTFHLKLSGAGSVTVDGKVYKNGAKFQVVLNAFDSFQILADGSAGSLTGTRISSNKVIFVYSGNDCARVPSNTSSCDHLVEQIPPISAWGNTFLVKSTPYRATGDIFHILASQNLTTVNIELPSGPLKVPINEGEVYEFNAATGESYAIRCTKPCLVVQFGKSHLVDNNKNFAPFMSIVPSIDQWSDDVTLVVPSYSNANFQCYANIFVKDQEKGNIKIKSVSKVDNMQWSKIPYTFYSTATVNLTSGQFRFYHMNPLKHFLVMFLCTEEYEAFGFPAGLRVFRRALRCTSPKMIPDDRKDNDCDDRVDEELLNGMDDDNDGKIDEDLATPSPVMNLAPNVQLTECALPPASEQSMQRISDPPNYQVFGMCAVRGNIKALKNDYFLRNDGCYSIQNRSWILTDGCLNTIFRHHVVKTYHIQPLKVKFPREKTIEVYSCDDSDFGHNFKSGSPIIESSCPGLNFTISHSDSGWEKLRRCSYSDYVVVKRTWIVFNSCNRVSGEQLIKIRKLGWRPSLTVTDEPVNSAVNKNITIPCEIFNWPPKPDVMWILPDGKTVKTNQSHTDKTDILDDGTKKEKIKKVLPDNSLLITDTGITDSGLYRCFAENDLGNATGVVNVTVHDDLVDVDASVTIKNLVFSPKLNKPFLDIEGDEDIRELRSKIKSELTQVFINMTGFQEVKLLGFRNGSVKVLFRVVIKKKNKDEDPKVIVKNVGKRLSVTVKSGELGDYKIVPTMELREKPPPPKKLNAQDVKESSVHVTWVPPDLDSMYGISGYVLQYKVFGDQYWVKYDVVKGDNHVIQGLEEGTGYLIRTKAANKFGHSEPSESVEITTLDKGLSGAEIALIILIPLVVLAICVFAWYLYKKRRKATSFTRSTSDHLLDNGVVRYSRPKDQIHINEHHEWKELSRDHLELGRVLGEGQFGMVMEGKLTQDDGSILRCAVKKLKRTATESDMKDLLNELDIMVQVGTHPNIVNLIGACAYGGPIMVVVEYAANGSLLRYLQKQSSRQYQDLTEYQIHISPKERLKIAADVANGMAHLARQRCVHRDLAARNVLLDENWTAKVSDFGLSRDVYTDSCYEKTTGGKLPAKWMAIEALEVGLNTTQSDVWSYGVLLWEIETGGCIPYPAFSAMEMLTALKQGYRLEKPMACSMQLYNIMLKCWEADPSKRPSFDDLYLEVHQLREDIPGSSSYYENVNGNSYTQETCA